MIGRLLKAVTGHDSADASKEDVLVSVHEAAHTIAAAEMGFEPIVAAIWLHKIGGWFSGGVVGCGVTFFDADESDKFGIAVVCYAGAAGEALVEVKKEGLSLRKAMEHALPSAGSDYRAAQALYLESNPIWAAMQLRAARAYAAELVEENWPEIEFIGRALRQLRHAHFTPKERQTS